MSLKQSILSAVEIPFQYRSGPGPNDIRRFRAHVFLTPRFLLLCPHLLLAFFIIDEIYGHFRKIRKLDKQTQFVIPHSGRTINIFLRWVFFLEKLNTNVGYFLNLLILFKQRLGRQVNVSIAKKQSSLEIMFFKIRSFKQWCTWLGGAEFPALDVLKKWI